MKGLGFPIICMEARRAADALKSRTEKTDKADAQALAEMLASGWYSPAHVKTMESHRLKALLGAREQLVKVKRQIVVDLLAEPGHLALGDARHAHGLERRGDRSARGVTFFSPLFLCLFGLPSV